MTAGHGVVGSPGAILLSEVSEEGRYGIAGFVGGEVEVARLHQMGFAVGMPLSVVSCPSYGMMVIKVGACRMALSPGTTGKILVKQRG